MTRVTEYIYGPNPEFKGRQVSRFIVVGGGKVVHGGLTRC